MVSRAPRRLLLSVLSAPALVAGILLPTATAAPSGPAADLTATALQPMNRIDATKSPSSRLAETDPELLARTDSEPVTVLLKLDHDSTAAYAGGVAGLAATSPSVTGTPLTGESPAEQAYEEHLAVQEEEVVEELTAQVPAAEVGRSLRIVYGGIAATIPADQVETVLEIDGVAAVQKDELRQPLTDSSPEFVNAPPVYDALGGTANSGAGVIYGNLDTGVWPEHPSFADQGNLAAPPPKADGTPRVCDYGDNPLTPESDPFVCQDKLIGGQPFLETYLDDPARAEAEPFHTARDSNGHGTHTASTSAGNIVEDVSVLGSSLPPIHGMAPGAWVIEYKVCGIEGCFSSDSAAAVAQAILDGVDVVNFSISGGENPFTDPVELAFLDAYAAGVFVSASAGNDGPGAGTANHLSPWVMTVAASTQEREFVTTLTLTADDGATASFEGASITPGAGPAPVVFADSVENYDGRCLEPAPAGAFTGMIVACERGLNARVDKGYNVAQGGAIAMVLYNPELADIETDTHWLPTVHLADGTDFVAFMESHTGVIGSFPQGTAQDGIGDVMAAFSSRGPAGLFIKPDVTAPGVQILAGDTPIAESTTSGPPDELFQAIAGTSMSSPHVAGAGILLRAMHADWTPGQIKSALMTTAITDVLKEDLETQADPFDMGSGRIDVGASAVAPLTLDESAEDFLAMANDPMAAVDLNIPSINVPTLPGRLTTTRTVTNTSGQAEHFTVTTDTPVGSRILVTPSDFELEAGESIDLRIQVRSMAYFGEQRFASIHIASEHSGDTHIPVAFVAQQGSVSLTQTCDPDEIALDGLSTCTVEAVNNSFEEQDVDLRSLVDRKLRFVDAEGATLEGGWRVRLNTTLAGAELGVPSVDPGSLAGYLPLADFGIDPQPIGDEEIINFDVPEYVYNGETYTTIGVDSNGYVVAGGAEAEDNECCNLPDGPSSARPNNMLAPFWTDLDGTGAPGISAGILTDGVDSWIVVQYDVFVWGTTDATTFQVWLGVNGEQDITYAYSPEDLPTNHGMDFLVGAENEVGEGEMEAVLPTEDLRVTSSDPAPGGAASYSFRVTGRNPGLGVVSTQLRAEGVPGVTVVDSKIRVHQP